MKFTRYISFIYKDIVTNFKYYFISVVSLAAAMLVISTGLGTYYNAFYETDALKDFFRGSQIYKVEFPYLTINEGYASDLIDFYEMSKDEGLIMFSYTSVIFEEKNTNDYKGNEYTDILSGDNLLENSDIRDVDGNKIVLGEDEGYSQAAVGYNLKDEFPVGTILTDKENGKKYKVAYILQPDSYWVDDDFLNSSEGVTTNLDNYIYISNDDYYLSGGYMISIFIMQNSAFIYGDEQTEEKIQTLYENAESCNIAINIVALKDYIREYKESYSKLYILTIILCILFGVVSAIIIIMTSVIDIMGDKHSIGIYMANGFLSGNIFNIILIKNLSRLIFPLIICLCSIIIKDSSEVYLYSGMRIFVVLAALSFICEIIATVITYKMIRKNTVLELIRGE